MRCPLFYLSFPLLAGLLLGCRVPIPVSVGLAGAVACALLAWPRARTAWLALGCAALVLGWTCPGFAPVGPALEGPQALRGRVLALRCGGGQLVALEALVTPGGSWVAAGGRVLVAFGDDGPLPGQRVLVRGQAHAPRPSALPGAPDSATAARLAGVRAGLRAERWVPLGPVPGPRPSPPDCRHQGILRALALGDRSQLPADLPPLLRATGTSHLLAISGLHLGLVAGLLGWLGVRSARVLGLRRHRSRPWLLGASAMVLGACAYGQLAGWPVSAIRAAAMLLALGVALALGRGREPRQLLGLAAWATVLLEPATAASAGWQLSFGAVLGLLIVGPRLVRALPPDLPVLLDRALRAGAATVAATLGTLPAAAWWFQELAPTAVPANLVAMPLVGLVATPGALLATSLPGVAGELAAAVACAALDLALAWLRLVQGPTLHPAVGPLGALLLVVVPLAARRPALGALAALVGLGLRLRPAGQWVITFLAVGQGSAVTLEWPDGRRWLVDGGPAPEAVVQHLRRRGIDALDVVALTHPHPDHMAGLPAVIEALSPDALWIPRPPRAGEDDFGSLVAAFSPERVHLPGDAALPALHPLPGWQPSRGGANEESLVLLLAHGRHTALLTGDIEARAEAALLPMLGPVDVLGVPHHGSRSSSTAAFVAALRPRVAVVSCGQDNRFGHPHPEVVARYGRSLLLRTDRHGTIEVRSDGLHLTVQSWLPGLGWRRWEAPPSRYASSLRTCSVGSSALTSAAASSPDSSASSESSRNR